MVVSGFHLQIRQDGGQLLLIHPHPLQPQHKTTNGIPYQGKHFQGDEPFTHVLSNGDVFRIGNQYGTLVTLTYHDSSSIARPLVPDIAPIPLGGPLITIGRGPGNTVVLNHPQVSGNHAHLERSGTTYRIVDQNSTNHVYVNGQRVTSDLLMPQDVIRIGPYDLIFTGTQLIQQSSIRSIRIDALNVIQYGDQQKILLNDISLTIPSGKFVAIVGGSGAGKTTLMDALNGTRPAKAGSVLYNGQDYYSSRASFSAQLGYVPQFNIIHKNLTVERVLYYAAKLRLPSDTTDQQTVFTAKPLPIEAEKVLFIMSLVAVLFGCNNSAREIVKEIQIYRRERIVNLGIMPYLFSKALVLGILCLLQCALLVIAVSVISPFPQTVLLPPPLEIYISLALTSLVSLMIGLMISCLAANSDQANSIIPVILIFQILFSCVIFKLTGFGEVFGGLFAMRWSMIGMGSSVGLTAVPMGYDPNDSSFPYAHDAGHVLGAWFALLVMIAILKRKDRLGR